MKKIINKIFIFLSLIIFMGCGGEDELAVSPFNFDGDNNWEGAFITDNNYISNGTLAFGVSADGDFSMQVCSSSFSGSGCITVEGKVKNNGDFSVTRGGQNPFNFSGKLTANNNTNTGQGSGTFEGWWDNIMETSGTWTASKK